MAFKIKDGIRIGTHDIFDNNGYLLQPDVTSPAKFFWDATAQGLAKDGIIVSARDGGSNNYRVTITPVALTGNHTQSLQSKTGNIALLTNHLGEFWGTTSSQLASVITDETGTGVLVFNNTPTIIDPIIDNIKATTGTTTADVWSEITTGSITIGSGLSNTGILNLAANGIGSNIINIGNTNSTVNMSGTLNFSGPIAISITSATVLGTNAAGTIISQTTTGSTTTVVLATSPTFVTSVNTSSDTFAVFNDTATTINAFGTATAINVGGTATSASTLTFGPTITNNTLKINGITDGVVNVASAVTTGTVNVFNDLSTGTLNIATSGSPTVNIGGNESTINIGAGGDCNLNIFGNGTDGTVDITTNVTHGVVNLFTSITKVGEDAGVINIGGANSDTNIGGNVAIAGDLIVNGTTTTVNSTVVTIDDPIFTLASVGEPAVGLDDGKDRGIEYYWHNGVESKLGFFGYDTSIGQFTFIPDATSTGEVFSGTIGTINAHLEYANLLNRPNRWHTISVNGTTDTPAVETDTLIFAVGQVDTTDGLTISLNPSTNTVTLGHADTSDLVDTTNGSTGLEGWETVSGRVIQDVDVDTYGHLKGVTVIDLDNRYAPRLTGEPNGFINRNEIDLSWDDGTRTLGLVADASAGFDKAGTKYYRFYAGGTPYIKSADSIQIDDTEGVWYIYYNESGVLSKTQTYTADIFEKYALVSILYWDAVNNQTVLNPINETHGVNLPGAVHSYLHQTANTAYISGLSIAVIDTAGTGAQSDDVQFTVTGGVIADEDVTHTIIARSALSDNIRVLYRTDTSTWRMSTGTSYPVIVDGVTGRASYNKNTDGTWSLEAVPNGKYVLAHLFAVPGLDYNNGGFAIVIGQQYYDHVPAATDGANTEAISLKLTGIAIPEARMIATFIIQTDTGYSNAVKSRFVKTVEGYTHIDWRAGQTSAATGAVSAVWGNITGTLTNQTDLITYITNIPKFGRVNVTDTNSGYTWADTAVIVDTTENDQLTVVSGLGINVDGDVTANAMLIKQDGSEHAYTKGLSVTAPTGTVQTILDSWSTTEYRAAKYVITVTQGSFYQTSEIMVFNNGSGAELTEYAVFSTNAANECVYGVTSNGASIILTGTAVLATGITYKIHRTLLAI